MTSRTDSEGEKEVVRLYKTSAPGLGLESFCYDLNKTLHEDAALPPALAEAVERLDGAIRFATPEPMTLYRAVDDAFRFKDLSVGKQAAFREFTSTCRNWQRLSTHMKASSGATTAGVLTLRVPRGFNVIDMEANASFGSEAEILLPRGTTFRLISQGEGCLEHYLGKASTRYVGLVEISLELLGANPPQIKRCAPECRSPHSAG